MLGTTGDFTIDWGDGNVETVSPTNRTVKTHAYSNVIKNNPSAAQDLLQM